MKNIMKLDHECVRSILLTIEEKHQYGKVLRLEEILQSDRLLEFNEDEIKYVLIMLRLTMRLREKPMLIDLQSHFLENIVKKTILTFLIVILLQKVFIFRLSFIIYCLTVQKTG